MRFNGIGNALRVFLHSFIFLLCIISFDQCFSIDQSYVICRNNNNKICFSKNVNWYVEMTYKGLNMKSVIISLIYYVIKQVYFFLGGHFDALWLIIHLSFKSAPLILPS